MMHDFNSLDFDQALRKYVCACARTSVGVCVWGGGGIERTQCVACLCAVCVGVRESERESLVDPPAPLAMVTVIGTNHGP